MSTPPPSSDADDRPTRARRTVAALLALAAALVGWVGAPDDWPAGEGEVTLTVDGRMALRATVDVGATEPLAFTGADVGLDFEAGIPADQPVTAAITVLEDGEPVRPAIDDVTLTLTLPDGRDELVPVVRWDDEAQALEANRRPTQGASLVLALLGAVVVLWVSEAVPLFVTSMAIPVVLVVGGVASAGAATAPFANPIIVLFFAGFLMAEAMRRTGLDHQLSVAIVARAGRRAVGLFAAMLALAAFLSMWMSNTAAAAVLIPIAIAVTAPIDHPGFRRAVVIGIAYASTIGGVGSAIGTPANQLAIEFLGDFGGRSISFVEWFGFGLPMVVVFLPIMGAYLWWRSDVHLEPGRLPHVQAVAREELDRIGGLDRPQVTVLVVFAAVAVGWLTQTWHGVHPGIVALAGAAVLFVLGEIRPEDLGRISWASLLTFGGGLTLGLFLVETGASDLLATRLVGLAGLPEAVGVAVVALITLALTTVASNTASAAILIPLAIPLAGVLGVDPTMLVVVVAIASSIDFALVVGTPPTMVAYSTHLYTAGQIFRRGIILDVVGLALLVVVVTRLWEWLGLL